MHAGGKSWSFTQNCFELLLPGINSNYIHAAVIKIIETFMDNKKTHSKLKASFWISCGLFAVICTVWHYKTTKEEVLYSVSYFVDLMNTYSGKSSTLQMYSVP